MHAAKKPLGEDVDLEEIARTTAGYTGADLENLMNEAAILTAKDGRFFINQKDVRQAFIKTGIGAEKKSRVYTGADLENLMNEAAILTAKDGRFFINQKDVRQAFIKTGIGAEKKSRVISDKDLENLMNEAAILTAKDGRFFINQKDVRQAFIKTGIGAEKKSRVISDKEKKITAYHEAGHAILFHVLPEMEPVHTISIIPTGMGAAGYTMPLPKTKCSTARIKCWSIL